MRRKRIYLIASVVLLAICIGIYSLYRMNHSVHSKLLQMSSLTEVNPRKVLAELGQMNRCYLDGRNYMLCNLIEAGALVHTQEYGVADSLLNIVSPYFRYRKDSLRLAEIYCYKGEIASHSNFLLEAIEYFTLCTQYNNDAQDLRVMYFYLNHFKGQTYHFKWMPEKEKEAKLKALELAKELKNQEFIEEAYSELAHYYARVEDGGESIPLLREAAEKGYSGALQARLLFLLGEKYADIQQLDSARICARQIPHLYQDSIDYLLGKIYSTLHQSDSARFYLNRSAGSDNPALCLKSYRQLLDLNVRAGSMSGVRDCLAKLACYEKQMDRIEDEQTLAKMENVDRLQKAIRNSEAEEVEYYEFWILYFWILVAAFICILILLSLSIILQKKKKNLQLKRQQARLDALKMQIDPHFIFNNLSILLDLVETGDKAAPGYVKALSKVYRHIVSNVDNNLSSVEDELTCLGNYIFLLKIRFGNAIQVDLRVDDAIRGRRIPPIVLQMLLENAMKHNRASEELPLLIRVYSLGDKLVVENNREPIASSAASHRIGLRNIQERYWLIGAPAPEIYEDGTIYRVTISTL